MNKDGMSQIIVWVFVLIAGGLLLALFSIIAVQQGQAGEDRINRIAVSQVQSILATQQAAGDVSIEVPVVPEPIDIRCQLFDDDFISSEINIGGYSIGLKHELVAGARLQTEKLVIFSKQLNLPYDIGNILYLTSENDILVIDTLEPDDGDGVEDLDSATQKVLDSIPEEIQTYQLDDDGSREKISGNLDNYDNVRVLLFGDSSSYDPNDRVNLNGRQNNIRIFVAGAPGPEFGDASEGGELEVYRYDNLILQSPETFGYVTTPMLLAYVYQNDLEAISCFQKKIDEHQRRHGQLQWERMDLLNQQYGTTCYQSPEPINRMRDAKLRGPMPLDAGTYRTRMDTLDAQNAARTRGRRCATIY